MKDHDLERILSEEEILPSSGFTASVMDASNLGCSLGEFGDEDQTFNGSAAGDGIPGRTFCALVSNLRKAVRYTTVSLAVGVTDSFVGQCSIRKYTKNHQSLFN